jgi:hypothetical protein
MGEHYQLKSYIDDQAFSAGEAGGYIGLYSE